MVGTGKSTPPPLPPSRDIYINWIVNTVTVSVIIIQMSDVSLWKNMFRVLAWLANSENNLKKKQHQPNNKYPHRFFLHSFVSVWAQSKQFKFDRHVFCLISANFLFNQIHWKFPRNQNTIVNWLWGGGVEFLADGIAHTKSLPKNGKEWTGLFESIT